MKVSIYGDAHITRKMGNLQDHWENSVLKIFRRLYEEFSENSVEIAVCLGDLFDKAVLEAKSVNLVTEILSIINSSPFPTYVLLGNHEIDSNSHNILDYLSEYDNIIPITQFSCIEDIFTFIPYSVNIEDVPETYLKGKYVFTHHDIYGSELAGGKLKASFGIDPNLFRESKRVFNGHIHLNSLLGNICNVGSITKMQQGELRNLETPIYYYLDTNTEVFSSHNLDRDFIAYLTVTSDEIPSILNFYDESVKFVFRIPYDEETPNILDNLKTNPRVLSVSLRKNLKDSIENIPEVRKSNLDIKEFLSNYIMKDESIPESEKEKMISLGISLLGD